MDVKQYEFLMAEARAVFFLAMRVGYAGGGSLGVCTKSAVPEIPGSKCIAWQNLDGRWKVVDTYVVTPHSNMSCGMTVVAFEDKPVWFMQYGGHYEDEALPFLKRCLAVAYEKNEFVGGRGPKHVEQGILSYHNTVRPGCSEFEQFEGYERIERLSSTTRPVKGGGTMILDPGTIGRHSYRGGSLARV